MDVFEFFQPSGDMFSRNKKGVLSHYYRKTQFVGCLPSLLSVIVASVDSEVWNARNEASDRNFQDKPLFFS